MDSNDYKQRMVVEYSDLRCRADKLRKMIHMYYNDALGFDLNCPIDLLMRQLMVMEDYMEILRERATIERVDLGD